MLKWTIRPRLMGDMVSPDYLSNMAQKGWQLKILGGHFLYFQSAEPKEQTYAMDVMRKETAGRERSIDSPDVQEYLAMCQEAGWQFVDSDGVFFVFRAEGENVIPLQTDVEAYRVSVQSLRSIRTLWKFMCVGAVALVMMILFIMTGLYSVLLSAKSMLAIGALSIFVIWMVFQWLFQIWIGRRAEKQLAAGAIPEELDDRKLAWIEVCADYLLLMVLSGALCILQPLPWMPVWLAETVLFLLWRVGIDLRNYICWRHFQSMRGVTFLLTALVILVFDFGIESLAGISPAIIPVSEENISWEPFVTEEDMGWPAMAGPESKLEGTSHAVQCRYSALGANSFTYELFYSPYDWAVRSFCKTSERYFLPGAGVVEISDRKEYDLDAAPYVEVSGWDAFWNHYLFCVDDWAMHVMTEDALTEEQMEILANKMNYYITQSVRGE